MDPRFAQDKGTGIFTGNELIVKGGLEHRIGLLTGYPGSPVAEVFDAAERIRELMQEKGIVVQIANNEALAAARLNGSQMQPVRAMAVMKSVGAHVASDGLALGNMAGTCEGGGAAVAVFGDDTWSEGTQVPADSRFISKHLYMPVLEPSTFQEIKDWVGEAFDLSEKSRLYIAYLVTSNQADGGGTVSVSENRYSDITVRNPMRIESDSISVDDRVVIPPHTTRKEDEVMHERFPRVLERVRERGLNKILYAPESGRRRMGFISSSLAYCYLEHALNLVGLEKAFPILKMGMTYPIDTEILKTFMGQVDEVCVVEEKRPFLEEQVKGALQELHQGGEIGPYRVWGKRFPDGRAGFPDTKGLNPPIVLETLAPLLKELNDPAVPVDAARVDDVVALMRKTADYDLQSAVRTPSFCPGCPHRDSASVLIRVVEDFMDPGYMKSHHGKDPVDLIFHGDIGCYTLLKYEPFDRLIHNLSGMGLGGGTGAGIDPFITNKQLVFMGDSTFFHSGISAISDSMKHGQDITYVILDNKTTAMTGHQPTPGVDIDIMGNPTFAQDIERIVKGMAGEEGRGPSLIARMDPADRSGYRKVLENALLKDGVKVVIADKECGITYHRRMRAQAKEQVRERGFLPVQEEINVTPEVCEFCLECSRATGCSGLTVEDSLHGPKIATDLSLCVADGACTKVTVANGDKTCPSFEKVTIRRSRAPVKETESVDLGELPEPTVRDFDTAWYAYIAGVGGMGINTIGAIISVAGAREGYSVRFTNKKGLAIRNGAVYSHVNFTRDDRVISQLTPYGHADLLLGLDILEAVRGMDPRGTGRVASERTTAIVDTDKRPTIHTLTGKDDYDPEQLETVVRRYSNEEHYFGMNVAEISERFLGNKIYSNSILLGVAYQRGALPLSLENIGWSMERNIKRSDLAPNQKAFDIGRKLAIDPEFFRPKQEAAPDDWRALLESKAAILRADRGAALSDAYGELVLEAENLDVADAARMRFVLGVYDLCQWGGSSYAQRYVSAIKSIYQKDDAARGYEATSAAISGLARVMAYKDEIYVAQLLTSREKRLRDYARYDIDPARGDRISYRHLTRPHFRVLGMDISFDLETRDWMLKLMKRSRFLRALLPGWHREEKEYRDWYEGIVTGFELGDEKAYANYVQALRLPEEVSGYREVIWPKMEAARQMADYLLKGEGEPPRLPETMTIEPAAASI